jgi:hypothetical protein
MNIRDFVKGDIITRVEPSAVLSKEFHPLTGELLKANRDRSYIGDKLTFFGIANGKAYFERHREFEVQLLGKELSLRLDAYSEGWERWVDPSTIYENGGTVEAGKKYSKSELNGMLNDALSSENFEEATRIRDLLKGFGS